MVEIINGTLINAELLFEQIAPTGGQANFDFQNIPGDFSLLQIFINGKTEKAATDVDGVYISFNGDTTDGNYYRVYHIAGGVAGASHDVYVASDRYFMELGSDKTATNVGGGVAWIAGYTSGFYKMVRSISGSYYNSNEYVIETSIFWQSTAKINRITFTTQSTLDFSAGTRCSIYGFG